MGKTIKKPVGIWIRVSTEDQARGESPEHHEKRAMFYAESKEWQVKEVYHLEAVSGKSVMEHPETKRMLAHIKSGHGGLVPIVGNILDDRVAGSAVGTVDKGISKTSIRRIPEFLEAIGTGGYIRRDQR